MRKRSTRPDSVREPVQVYLAADDRDLLNRLAEETGLTKAEILRRGVRKGAEHEVEAGTGPVDAVDGDQLRQLIGRELRKHVAHLAVRLAIRREQSDLDARMPQRASSGISVESTMITESSAWFAMYVSWSGKRRRFSVCRTAPMLGTAAYAAMCSALFHVNVPTRWPHVGHSPESRSTTGVTTTRPSGL